MPRLRWGFDSPLPLHFEIFMTDKYSLQLRILHWLIGLLIIGLLCGGQFMTSLDKGDALFHLKYSTLYPGHKMLGLLVLILLLIRIVVRFQSNKPPLPESLKCWERFLTKSVHGLLYLVPIVVASAGYVMSSSSGRGFKFFVFDVPLVIAENPALAKITHSIHIYGTKVIMVLIALHIAGFLKHLIFDKTNLLKRIV